METKIDFKKCLNAFACIVQKGERKKQGYFLDGIYANGIDDGYTVMLSDNDSTLTIYFHNTYSLNSPSAKTKDQFMERVYVIADRY